ncbi:DUF4956 domain-containing protein [Alkalitalea saponilacus]|uniref:Uncharacterized membrane protein YhiD, involved in acid resistance n=1 Tax=Alkalitalea saponilacus TaxID=889453 RepID=A0A1T5HKP5_9BACT|nr:DUF4956 domain-containing protein [Alkalitalea saponilacus]ASB47786.1 hypothetical protein CDL62_00780 [Alkalitalea saponilacus]SKC21237.1 Uncharacterized membrane protein YhiD, involved in acid resistance [Alkalitalea saponilacus]
MEDIQSIFTFSITARDVFANVLVAMTCGFIIALLYKHTYKGLNYSSAFTISIIMLTMITAIVIMVIGNNLARAFGMVGAMSIIRFRTAVKDASDIMFIFFALAIGLAAGVKLYAIAFLGTFMVGAAYLLVTQFSFSLSGKREFLMHITTEGDGLPENPFGDSFKQYCKTHKLVNVKTIGDDYDQIMEYSYYVNLKDQQKGSELVSKLRKIEGVHQVNLFFDED